MKTRHVIVATQRLITVVESEEGKRSELEAMQKFAELYPNATVNETYRNNEFGPEQSELWRLKGFVPVNGEKI
jgi:hypothetical protein